MCLYFELVVGLKTAQARAAKFIPEANFLSLNRIYVVHQIYLISIVHTSAFLAVS